MMLIVTIYGSYSRWRVIMSLTPSLPPTEHDNYISHKECECLSRQC